MPHACMACGTRASLSFPTFSPLGAIETMKFLPLVWAGLWRKPARTLFTVLSVIVAFVLFGLLQGMNSAFALIIQEQKLDRLFIDPRFPGQPLPRTHIDEIRKVQGITLLTEISFLGGYYQEQTNNVSRSIHNPTFGSRLARAATLEGGARSRLAHAHRRNDQRRTVEEARLEGRRPIHRFARTDERTAARIGPSTSWGS